jgi:hypothetical protein
MPYAIHKVTVSKTSKPCMCVCVWVYCWNCWWRVPRHSVDPPLCNVVCLRVRTGELWCVPRHSVDPPLCHVVCLRVRTAELWCVPRHSVDPPLRHVVCLHVRTGELWCVPRRSVDPLLRHVVCLRVRTGEVWWWLHSGSISNYDTAEILRWFCLYKNTVRVACVFLC